MENRRQDKWPNLAVYTDNGYGGTRTRIHVNLSSGRSDHVAVSEGRLTDEEREQVERRVIEEVGEILQRAYDQIETVLEKYSA